MNAIWALGTFRTESATTALIRTFLEDRNYSVRGAAARALGNSGDPRAIDVLIKTTRGGFGAEQYDIAEALVQFGESAVGPLIEALGDNNEDVRSRAVQVLGKIGNRRAVKQIITLLRDEDKHLRFFAAMALGAIGDQRALKPLIKAFCAGQLDTAEPLKQFGEPAINLLIKIMLSINMNNDVRQRSAEALGAFGVQGIGPLIQALGHEEYEVRVNAGDALVPFGESAIDPLIEALGHTNEKVRGNAVGALGKIGSPRAINPLLTALGDNNEFVRRNCAFALCQILELHGIGAFARRNDLDRYERIIKTLISRLSDTSEVVRQAAAFSLSTIGASALEALIKASNDVDENVRQIADEALANFAATSVEPLTKALGALHAARERAGS